MTYQGFYQSRLFHVLNSGFLGFLILSVLVPWDDLFQGLFFAVVIPASLVAIRKYPELVKASIKPSFGMLFLIFLMVISSFFVSDAELSSSFQNLRYGVELFFLIVAVSLCMPAWLERPLFISSLFFYACIFVGVYGISDYFITGDFPKRLTIPEISFLKLPILGAGTLFCVWLAGFLIKSSAKQAKASVNAVEVTAFCVVSFYILLSQSRGVILAVCVFLMLMLVFSGLLKRRAAFWACGGAVIILLVLGVQSSADALNFFDSMYERGTSYRLEIWATVLKNPPENLIFGSGIATDYLQTPAGQAWLAERGWGVSHTHNLLLGTYYSGGLISLLVFLVYVGLLITAVLRSNWRYEVKLSMFLALISIFVLTSTDTYHFIEKPKPIWWIFWVPFLFVVAISHSKLPSRADVYRQDSIGEG
jgi:predicted tellurium resistance membrane protein TerC